MGRQRVEELEHEGVTVDSVYALRWKEVPGEYQHGYRFRMKVADATGEITVTYWGGRDEAEVRAKYDQLKVNSLVRVVGTTSTWNGRLVVGINPGKGGLVEPAPAGEYDQADFLPCTSKDVDEMFVVLMSYAEGIEEPHTRSLLLSLLSDPSLAEQFRSSPASVRNHCGWVGGLLEHTLNVVRICDNISLLYPELDRDLLLAGAILHDLGKVRCYDVQSTITESAEGRMLGHLAIGAEMVRQACDALPGFPPNLRLKLVHMVLASHGSAEKGSPVEPSIPEALALNYADEMDAYLEGFILARQGGGPNDDFVFDPRLRTKVYRL